MSAFNERGLKAFACAESLSNYLRTRLDSSGNAALAGPNDDWMGTVITSFATQVGDRVTVILRDVPGTRKFVANGAITQYAKVYPALAGLVGPAGTTKPIGVALNATSNSGEIVEVLLYSDSFLSELETVFQVRDDFVDLLLTGAEALWKGTQTDSGTFTILDVAGGIMQLEASDGTIGDNDESYCFTQNKPFLIAAGKPITFSCRLALKAADTDNANIIAGVTSFGSAANALVDDGGGPPASFSGAVFYKKDLGTGTASAWKAMVSIGGTQTDVPLTAPGNPSTTYQRLTIEIIPTSATLATVNFYVDGVLVGSIATFTYTGAAQMSAGVGVKNGGSTVNTTLFTDYIVCRQAR